MPSVRILKEFKDQIYFITLTTKDWFYFFDRNDRFEILEDCFVFFQKNRGLRVYAFVFMLNHLHFIAAAEDMGSALREMKSFLSKIFKRSILEFEPSSMRQFFQNEKYCFWEKTNYPKLIYSYHFFEQKVNYIHMNPVKKQYVHFPEDWRWSSACKIPTRIVLSELEL